MNSWLSGWTTKREAPDVVEGSGRCSRRGVIASSSRISVKSSSETLGRAAELGQDHRLERVDADHALEQLGARVDHEVDLAAGEEREPLVVDTPT